MAQLILLVASIIGICSAYPDGAPLKACSTMNPGHGVSQQNSGLGYTIASACYVIFPDDSMRVRIWDRQTFGPFQGLLMQVRNGESDISGTWDSNEHLKQLKCNGLINSAVTHRNDSLKKDVDTQVLWTAPSSCKQNEQFEIRATIALEYSKWTQVSVPLVCNPDYSNVAVMERVRPPLPVQYCAQGSWAILPKLASTSFETTLRNGGWRHLYGARGFRFIRQTGPTPTAGTGPNAAQDGNYYMYYEASGRKDGDMAGLVSPFGIQGCFCFSFYCHMNTDGKIRFTLRTIGEIQREILSTTLPVVAWSRVAYTITSDKPVVFIFQVFSSGSEKGDIGLDNIKVEPGPCTNLNGYGGALNFV